MKFTKTEKFQLRESAKKIYPLVLIRERQKAGFWADRRLEKPAWKYTVVEVLLNDKKINRELNQLKFKYEKVNFIRKILKDVFPEVGVTHSEQIWEIINLRQTGKFGRYF